jgi:glycosyltransferase involved in cell wall biosynthesis
MPIASILVPVYNRESLIERTLMSALAQTVADIEIVVVDNQSTDRTYEVCASMAAQDSRIVLHRNDTNVGPVRNWIECARRASAPFSKIVFSDDLIAPNYLERTLPHLIAKDTGFVFTPIICGEEEWKGVLHYRNFLDDCRFTSDAFIRAAVRMGGYITPVSPGAALFRTSDLRKHILTELPGITDYDFAATGAGVDWLIFGMTALHYTNVAYVCDPLVFFRQHPGSISIRNENDLVPRGYALAQQWFVSRVHGI